MLASTTVGAAAWAQAVQEPSAATMVDAETAFQQARAAAERGDVAGAIAALERVLQTNPDLANVKLELGLLYLRAGNPDLARSYLQLAVNAPDAPAEARTRADQALRRAASSLSRWGVSGSLFGGLYVQSNPNGSPSAVSVVGPGGIPVLISGDDLSIARGWDLSTAFTGTVDVSYGLGGERGNEIVASLAASQINYKETEELDATFLNAQLGPRFFVGPVDAPSGSIRPYLTGTHLALGHAAYFTGLGGGVTVFVRPSLATAVTGQVAVERRNYHNSRRRPAADEQTGTYASGVLETATNVSPRTRLSVAGLFEKVDAEREYWSRSTLGGQASVAHAIAPPSGSTSWLVRLTGTYRRSDYSAPDPLIDPTRSRNEDRFEIEGGLSIPATQRASIELRASQTWNESNLPNFDYDNTQFFTGMNYRF